MRIQQAPTPWAPRGRSDIQIACRTTRLVLSFWTRSPQSPSAQGIEADRLQLEERQVPPEWTPTFSVLVAHRLVTAIASVYSPNRIVRNQSDNRGRLYTRSSLFGTVPQSGLHAFAAGPHRCFRWAKGYPQAQFRLAQIHQRSRLHAVASVANWAAVSIPPGSRTCTSAPSVAWCTCRPQAGVVATVLAARQR